jgi:hypothetical protein
MLEIEEKLNCIMRVFANGVVRDHPQSIKMSHAERVDLGREAMRVCFEHLASRTVIALETLRHLNIRTASLNNLPDHAGNRRKAELHHARVRKWSRKIWSNSSSLMARPISRTTRRQILEVKK